MRSIALPKVFQSTPLHEGRLEEEADNLPDRAFQSTPLHEGRLLAPAALVAPVVFQSTPLHEGRHQLGRGLTYH